MSRYRIYDQYGMYFVTLTVQKWADVFTRKRYKNMLIKSLSYCQREKGLEISAYVIMSNHLHLVVRATGDLPLSNILGDFKKFTAKAFLNSIEFDVKESRRAWLMPHIFTMPQPAPPGRERKFWIPGNHPIELFSAKWITQKVNYIHQNPVKAGWVDEATEYPYSSAGDYAGRKGLLEINVLPLAFE